MICENCGKEVNEPYCPYCGHPTGFYKNMKLEYDPDNADNFIKDNEKRFDKKKDVEEKKTVVRRGERAVPVKTKEEIRQEKKQAKAEAKEQAKQQNAPAPVMSYDGKFFNGEVKSEFTGGAFGLFFVKLFVGFASSVTLGLALPAMICFYNKWIASHTVINGRKMYFDGKGIQLFGKYVLWTFLSIITIGIYSFWYAVNMKKWITSHTHYVDEVGEEVKSKFTGGAFGLFFVRLGAVLLSLVTLTIGTYWAICMVERWTAKHTEIDCYRLQFNGKGGALLGKCLVWTLLTIITVGIYSFWYAVKYKKWITANTDGVND